MMLGLSLANFTLLHVVISLIAIVAGLIVMFGMLGSRSMPGLTAIFLILTILTNVTGFGFPFEQLLPSHIIAIISLVLLAVACLALYVMSLKGAWRPIYIITALLALYLNVLAPGNPPSGPVFGVVQGIVLVFFAVVIIGVWRRYRPMSFA